MPDNEILIKIIQDNFNNFRQDMNNRFDKFEKKIEKKINTFNQKLKIGNFKKYLKSNI